MKKSVSWKNQKNLFGDLKGMNGLFGSNSSTNEVKAGLFGTQKSKDPENERGGLFNPFQGKQNPK